MGGLLYRVVQRRQLDITVAAAESGSQEPVGEHRVLGQQGAVQVAADGVTVDGPFGAVPPVVTTPNPDLSEGPGVGTEVRQAAVVLESDQLAVLLRVDHGVADEPLGPSLRHQVEQADARQRRGIVRAVLVAKQLIAAADCEQRCALLDGGLDRLPLGPLEIG